MCLGGRGSGVGVVARLFVGIRWWLYRGGLREFGHGECLLGH